MQVGPEIEIWLKRLPLEPPERDHCYGVLSAPERQRLSNFRVRSAEEQFLAGRALVRRALSHRWGRAPADWSFATTARGRPYLENPALHDGLDFNVSHTKGLVACALGDQGVVGIDVEWIGRDLEHLEIAPSILAGPELKWLHRQPPAIQRESFFRLWTLKEAYVKARGEGLAMPLNDICFTLDGPEPVVEFGPEVADGESGWVFWELKLNPHHRVALAASCGPLGATVRYRTVDRMAHLDQSQPAGVTWLAPAISRSW